ncbi:FAD-dependent oxidoreductase [Alcanivorax sp. 1008]|uniref:NAD(P)/FAD-dependent oxidoreductase n=1 Tax=Alcanivorax sp. 1008 TaxID=2816853 RepID=UPI001D275C31|nr:FAD-dependent oxidoreductase [Alcanivorax sp. 1008]
MSRVVVVGAGVAGLLSALELSDRGWQVSLLDAGPARPSASWAGGGILSPLFPWRYPSSLLPLTGNVRRDYATWQQRIIQAGGRDPELLGGGMVVLVDGAEQRQASDWAASNNIALQADAAASWFPWLEQSAICLPDVARIRNPRLLKGLAMLVQKSSIRWLQGHVEAVASSPSGVRLEASCGVLEADHALITAGAWSHKLLPELVSLTYPVKGQMLLYQAPQAFPEKVLLTEQGYLIPRSGGLLLAGSTVEPDQWDGRPTERACKQLAETVAQLWPVLQKEQPLAQWSGIRPGCKRPVPIIGQVPDSHDRLWVNTGHFRNGLVCGPASARLVAELISGETPFCNPAPYSVSSSSSSPP